jgi:hypothetical protein
LILLNVHYNQQNKLLVRVNTDLQSPLLPAQIGEELALAVQLRLNA